MQIYLYFVHRYRTVIHSHLRNTGRTHEPDVTTGDVSAGPVKQSQTKDKEAEIASKEGEQTQANDSQKCSSSDDDDDFSHGFVKPLPSDVAKQAYIDAVGMPGQLLCFLRVYNGEPVFGILSDVDEAHLFGTRIMHDGQYQTQSCRVLGQAAARCKERNYYTLCPRVELLGLLLERNKDIRAMKHDMRMVESDYKIAMRKAAKKLKVANAAAHKLKEDAAAQGENQNVDDDAQMQEAHPTPPPQTDNPTNERGEAVDPHASKRKSPVPSGLDAQDHLSHKTTLVDASTTPQDLDNACDVSVPTDAVELYADTRKSPVPTEDEGRMSPFRK
jgi:hypothetical protein